MNTRSDGGAPPPEDEAPRDDDGGLFGDGAADALALAEDAELVTLGGIVLAELKDRGLLRVLLRNRADAATGFEVEAIREAEDGLDLIAAGLHAETPEEYPGWVAEAETLSEDLAGLDADAAATLLTEASDEALLLALDAARLAESDEEEEDEEAESIGDRITEELLRRGIIEPVDDAEA